MVESGVNGVAGFGRCWGGGTWFARLRTVSENRELLTLRMARTDAGPTRGRGIIARTLAGTRAGMAALAARAWRPKSANRSSRESPGGGVRIGTSSPGHGTRLVVNPARVPFVWQTVVLLTRLQRLHAVRMACSSEKLERAAVDRLSSGSGFARRPVFAVLGSIFGPGLSRRNRFHVATCEPAVENGRAGPYSHWTHWPGNARGGFWRDRDLIHTIYS